MTAAEREAALEDWSSLKLAREGFETRGEDPISVKEALLISIAISLKRIADALETIASKPFFKNNKHHIQGQS